LNGSNSWEFITATAAALIIGVLVSWGSVYGLNRYFESNADPMETTGSARFAHPPN
jgi:hypothetical protein